MNSSESAEEIVKLTLEGVEVVAKIAGQGAERVAVALYAMAKGNVKTKGRTSLNQMLKSGGQLQIFSLKQEDMKKFHEVAKKYGVLYTALVDKKQKDSDGLIDIIVRAEDAPRINRIVERFNLATVDIETIKEDIENDKIEGIVDRGVEGKSDEERIVEEIFSKPIQKETNEMENPEVAKTEDAHPSEPLLENKKESGAASSAKKTSVAKTLKDIKEEIKNRYAPKFVKEKLKEGKPITVIDATKHKITTYTPRNKKNKNRKER